MSGKHQRRLWVLPVPSGSTLTYYDRMSIILGRANSLSILNEYDTFISVLTEYLIQHDTLQRVLTNISTDIDTLINISVSFNYDVSFDTLVKIITQLPPISSSIGGGSGRINKAPFGDDFKKKKNKVIYVNGEILSSSISDNNILVRVDAMFDLKPIINEIKLLTSNNIQNLKITGVDLINDNYRNQPIRINIERVR